LPEGEFQLFERFIGAELTQMRMQEIRRLNLNERTSILADRLQQALPNHYTDISRRWTESCEKEIHRFLGDLSEQLRRVLLNTSDLAPVVIGRRASGMTGLFGMSANIIYYVKRLVKRETLLHDPVEVLQIMEHRLISVERQALDCSVDRLRAACIAAGQHAGLDSDVLALRLESMVNPEMESAVHWLNTETMTSVMAQLRDTTITPGPFLNLLLNLPAWSWIGFWVYRVVEPLFRGLQAPLETVPGAGIVLLMILGCQWYLVDRLLHLTAGKQTESVITSTLAELSQKFRATFTPSLENTARDITRHSVQFQKVIAQLRQTPPVNST
jgi:hypothetical protein